MSEMYFCPVCRIDCCVSDYNGICTVGHKVCITCSSQLLNSTCPICRGRMTFNNTKDEQYILGDHGWGEEE